MPTPPSTAARSRSLRWGAWLVVPVVIVVAAVAGHSVGTAWGHPTTPELAGLTPTLPPVAGFSTPPPSLADVARGALPDTVTVEAVTSTDEQLGTAWLFDSRGDFVTNAHVVSGALSIRLRDRAGGSHVGTVIGSDTDQDIAVIRSADGFAGTPVPLAATAAAVPDQVVAIASSRATGHADVTVEVVSRLGVDVSTQGNPDVDPGTAAVTVIYHSMLAVSGTAIFQGNSGGPLLNRRGEVVGIITLASRTQPEAYAIPISRVVDEIRRYAAKP